MPNIDREVHEKRVTVRAALAVGFVCIIVGVPLWWKTTTVYRVQLPYTQISQLAHVKMKVSVKINVTLVEPGLDDNAVRLFQDRLSQVLAGMSAVGDKLWVDYRLTIGNSLHPQQQSPVMAASNIHELDSIFKVRPNNAYEYTVVILSASCVYKPTGPVIGRKKTAYIPASKDLLKVIPSIVTISKSVLVNEAALLRVIEGATGAKHQQSDKESMRKVRSHSGYQLTFTLLNPQPDMVDARWNVPQAVKDYLNPLLGKFEDFIDLNVKSQYLHYLGIGTSAERDETTGQSYLRQQNLPHIINPIEGYLASHVSTDPDLNFVVYVPTRSHSPTIILDSSGTPAPSNSFVIPRWGGFLIYNVPALPDNASLPVPVEIDMKHIMEVFIGQIRLLLGVVSNDLPRDIALIQPGREGITQWEMDAWLRSQSMENIATTIVTLSSLADLLEKINNMVINDHIGRQVEKAVSYVEKSSQLLADANLREAFIISRNALTASESAFFDPSLLELLYFPEDQKFAIYIPLFLPIGIPIMLSILEAIKYLRKKPDKTKTE